jgi:hypothetical protein
MQVGIHDREQQLRSPYILEPLHNDCCHAGSKDELLGAGAQLVRATSQDVRDCLASLENLAKIG